MTGCDRSGLAAHWDMPSSSWKEESFLNIAHRAQPSLTWAVAPGLTWRIIRTGIPISRYVGVDISPAMVGRARQKFSWLKSAEFYIGDIERLSFGDNTFDFTLSTWALEHVPQIEVAVTEALRVLKRGVHLAVLFHSIPDFPWSIPVRLAEPVFRFVFPFRFLDTLHHPSSHSLRYSWHFVKGFHTVLVLGKDVSV